MKKQSTCICFFFVFFVKIKCEPIFQSRCPQNILGSKDRIFIINVLKQNSYLAREGCSKFGGILAEVTKTNIKNKLINQSSLLLIPEDLLSVSVFENPTNRFRLKYRANVSLRDSTNLQKWRKPPQGNLRSFSLYRTKTAKFFKRVRFCFVNNRDAIRLQCNQGWNFNFDLFGGSATTTNTITLYNYNYFVSNQYSTILSFNDNLILRKGDPGKLKRDQNPNVTVFIQDISVFIGAQSNVNQTNWFWNNGTIVNDAMFPTPNKSICQQMAWPLTYDDGINLRPKRCYDEAQFICQINFIIEAENLHTCNGSFLRVFWNRTEFYRAFVKSNNFYLQISFINNNFTHSVSFNRNEAIIPYPKPQSFDILRATLRIRYCSSFKVTAQTAIRAKNDFYDGNLIDLSFSNCILKWYYNTKNTKILFYKIQVVIGNETIEKTVRLPPASEVDRTNQQLIRQELNFTKFSNYSMFSVKIKTFWCDGQNNSTVVIGSCSSDLQELSNQKGIIVLSILLLVVFLGLGIVSYIISRSKRKVKGNDPKENKTTNIAYLEFDSQPITPRVSFHTYEEINDYVDMFAFGNGNTGALYEHMENAYEQPIPTEQ